ncbi:hypothetical protein M5K25_003629 [Dendrobium thyrsiflorum]|uniref:Aminotransferase-like plant mobile domain-containing protein n=1 Tax=Dendrobium thyrsiflorum TaxID=117978 RepID=A0ABD0VKD5_DENTH
MPVVVLVGSEQRSSHSHFQIYRWFLGYQSLDTLSRSASPRTSSCFHGFLQLTVTGGVDLRCRAFTQHFSSTTTVCTELQGCQHVLEHYHSVYRASGVDFSVPVDVWLSSFLQHCYLTTVGASVYDPFGLDLLHGVPLSEETAEPFLVAGYSSPALPGVIEDLFLAGFLATWICTFILPLRTGFVRYSVILAASQLSQGQRLSLAPAVLSRIYRSLCTAFEATSLELRDLALPWHYLYGWIHLHILGAFSCLECTSYFAERGYPTVLQLSQASATLESERIRLFFFSPHLVPDRFSLVYQPDIVCLPSHLRGTVIVDGVDHRGRRTLLQRTHSLLVAEYFISMRPGWLCHRSGSTVTLEGYQPNRVARQFGFFQTTAYDGRPLVPGVADTRRMDTVPLETRLYAAALTWLHLLRLGTGSSFCWLSRLLRQVLVTHGWPGYGSLLALLWSTVLGGTSAGYGSLGCRGDRGTCAEACTTTGTVVSSPARASNVAPAPPCTEVPRSSRRRAGSQCTTSSKSTPGPSSDFFFSVDPYGSFWPGESSGADVVLPSELFERPSDTQMTLELVPAEFSFFPASHSVDPVALEGFDYSSEIPCYVPVPPNLRTTDRCHHLVVLLRDLVSSIDPRSPESWVGFTSSASWLLGLFADFGVDTTELVFWETVCREAESCIWQLRSLSVTRVRVTLPQLEEMVASRRTIADDTQDRLDRSTEALRRHRQSSSGMAQEVDGLTSRMQELWRDIRHMMYRTRHLQVGRDRRDCLTRREEQRHRSLQQEVMEADSLLVQAVEQFQRAQTEFQTLDEITGRLQSLRDRLY